MKFARQLIASSGITAIALGLLFASGCSSTPYQQSAGEYIDSKTIGTKVKAALLEDSVVKGLDVKVEVWKDVVQLNGFVDSAEQKERAEMLAWNVTGVKNVRNNLGVKDRIDSTAVGAAPQAENATDSDAEIIFARVLANPNNFYGRQAALAGQVNVIFSPNAFTLSSLEGVSDREMLVLAGRDTIERVVPNDRVRVQGRFERFDRATAEEKLGRRLRDEEFSKWNEKPVLFLNSISKWAGAQTQELSDSSERQ